MIRVLNVKNNVLGHPRTLAILNISGDDKIISLHKLASLINALNDTIRFIAVGNIYFF